MISEFTAAATFFLTSIDDPVVSPYSSPVIEALREAVPTFGIIGSGILLGLVGVAVFFSVVFLASFINRIYKEYLS